jgi:hypothetical protein
LWHLKEYHKTIKQVLNIFNQPSISISYKHEFFKKRVENYRDFRWVDIEYEYYMALVEIYRDMEKSNVLRSDFHFSRVKPLNECFESIKKRLVEYLESIDRQEKFKNDKIEKIMFEGTGTEGTGKGSKMYVYFNYTSTLDFYTKNKWHLASDQNIYIHGKLYENMDSIIFGYGDEMDPHYERIENLNTKEFLDNMKSFGYFRTNNYQRVIRYANSGKFTVKILGHSCGLSDRILLNTIFEHENCEKIKIYHYEKSQSDNDYFEKTQEISRHFKASRKGELRMRIVPFDKNNKMPQNPKDN